MTLRGKGGRKRDSFRARKDIIRGGLVEQGQAADPPVHAGRALIAGREARTQRHGTTVVTSTPAASACQETLPAPFLVTQDSLLTTGKTQ